MKISILVSALIFASNLAAQGNKVKIYPFKSATVEYKYEASFTGTHIKYIDDYGYKQADYISKIENFGGNSERHSETIILIGEKAYTINLYDSTAAVGRNLNYDYYLQNSDKSSLEISEAILRAAGYRQTDETAELFKKKCKIWKSRYAEAVTWAGLILQNETNFMTMMVEKAVSFKTNTPVAAELFEIPQGMHYISADIYQGAAGLKLEFADNKGKEKNNADHLRAAFNSDDLKGCNNFIYFTVNRKKVDLRGDNDYNKIDPLIIKSQRSNMTNKKLKLSRYRVLIFKRGKDIFGKMQIKQIDKNSFQVRYALFNNKGAVTDYSDGASNGPDDYFNILKQNDNRLTIIPKNSTVTYVLPFN